MTHKSLQSISFLVGKSEYATVITPIIDGIALTELVENFEIAQGYDDPAGGYGAIDINAFKSYGTEVPVLACGDCGIMECWPLITNISNDKGVIMWSDFRQPFRKQRDYSTFGPFLFSKEAYESALQIIEV